MEWRDEGIIIGSRRHGESSVILEVMTRVHGRHMGIVRGGRSRRMQPVLQAGNRVELVWRARLDEHLGMFQVEPLELNAARLLSSACAVYALQTLAAHLRLLPERDPHPGMFETLSIVLEHLEDHLHISNRAQTCQPTRDGALEAFERGGRTWLRWRTARKCALPLGRLEFVNTSLTRSRFGFHHLGTIRVGEKTYRHVFDTTNPAFQLDFSEPTASSSASSEASNNAPTLLLLSLSVIALFVVGGWFWRRR